MSETRKVSPAIARQFTAQLADLVKQVVEHSPTVSADGSSFFVPAGPKSSSTGGILGVEANLSGDIATVKFQLLRSAAAARVSPDVLLENLAKLGDKTRLVSTDSDGAGGQVSWWAEIQIQVAGLSMVRSNAILSEIMRINELATALQMEVPCQLDMDKLKEIYQPWEKWLDPVVPARVCDLECQPKLLKWADRGLDLLNLHWSFAVVSDRDLEIDYLLGLMANRALENQKHFGRVYKDALNNGSILDIVAIAPGYICVPIDLMKAGYGPRNTLSETTTLIKLLEVRRKPVVFFGSNDDFQEVFYSSGDSDGSDYIHTSDISAMQQSIQAENKITSSGLQRSIPSHTPSVDYKTLVDFTVRAAAWEQGGLSKINIETINEAVATGLRTFPVADRYRYLGRVVTKQVLRLVAGKSSSPDDVRSFIATMKLIESNKL